MTDKVWRWYSQRPDEVLMDMDSPAAVYRALRRMPMLPFRVVSRALYPSYSPGHYHMVLRLSNQVTAVTAVQRAAVALWLGSDSQRVAQDLMRLEECARPILITSVPWPDFWRQPDGYCQCASKHVDDSDCAMLRNLRPANVLRPFPLEVLPLGTRDGAF